MGVFAFYGWFMYIQTQPGHTFGQLPYILGIAKVTDTPSAIHDSGYNPIRGFPVTPTYSPSMTPVLEYGPRVDGSYGEVTAVPTPFKLVK